MTVKEMAENLLLLANERERFPEKEHRVELNLAMISIAEKLLEHLNREVEQSCDA